MLNKVQLIGRLGKDPEIRYTPSGDAIANLTIATSETWKDKASGERKEKTEWHRVVIFGKLAEIVGEYWRKGNQVYVEGKLQTRKWQGNDGKDNYTTEIVVDSFSGTARNLTPRGDSETSTSTNRPSGTSDQAPPRRNPTPQESSPPLSDMDDDIPF